MRKKSYPCIILLFLLFVFGMASFSYSETPTDCLDLSYSLWQTVDEIPVEYFRKEEDKVLLVKKVRTVHFRVYNGLYDDALDKLVNDVIEKINGCSDEYGTSEKNDWIIDCESQAYCYGLARELLTCLRCLIYNVGCLE